MAQREHGSSYAQPSSVMSALLLSLHLSSQKPTREVEPALPSLFPDEEMRCGWAFRLPVSSWARPAFLILSTGISLEAMPTGHTGPLCFGK